MFKHVTARSKRGMLTNKICVSNCVLVSEFLSESVPLFWCFVGAFLGGMALAMCGKLDLKETAEQRYISNILRYIHLE